MRALALAALLAVCTLPWTSGAGVPARWTSIREPAAGESEALPVVLWHGMGDSCCAAGGMGAVKALIEKELGVFVHSIATGEGEYRDMYSSFLGNVNDQVATVCKQLKAMHELKGGFNAIGFSQGGQFLRAVVERCGHKLPPIHTLVTVGGQHQGVMNTPGCTQGTGGDGWAAKACSFMQTLLARGAYAPWVRENVVQAQYFKDPHALDEYLASNVFLPDVNNEKEDKNSRYANNLASLERFVMYRFEDDSTVVPRDSAWFSFFDGDELVPLRDQSIYKEDWIGLQRLDSKGALYFESAPGEHMQFSLSWFKKEIMDRWLQSAAPSFDSRRKQ